MKKILALLLAVLMLASVGYAWAEETTEEEVEITFQGIPWGSSRDEIKSWAIENGFQFVGPVAHYTQAFLDESGKYVSDGIIYSTSDSGKFLQAYDNDSFQIAGYTIPALDFHFDVRDGKTELNTVVVHILHSDATNEQAQAILDDLEQKLITVYGENAVSSTDNSPSGSIYGYDFSSGYTYSGPTSMKAGDRYRKVGAADTAICLTYSGLRGVMLVYGKTHVSVAEEKTDTPLTIDSFNLGGL